MTQPGIEPGHPRWEARTLAKSYGIRTAYFICYSEPLQPNDKFFKMRHIQYSFLPLCERACGPSDHTASWIRHDSTCTECSAARHLPPPRRLFCRRKNRRREPPAHPPPRRWRHGRERFVCAASAGSPAWSLCRRRSRYRRCAGSVPICTIYLSSSSYSRCRIFFL